MIFFTMLTDWSLGQRDPFAGSAEAGGLVQAKTKSLVCGIKDKDSISQNQ